MLNKYSSVQIIYGALVLPLLIVLCVLDRIICVPLIWLSVPGFKEYMTNWKMFVMSLYRIGFVLSVIAAIKLISWIL
jgi:hypothetical protein